MPNHNHPIPPGLHARLSAVEAALPPDGMSITEVVDRCLVYYRRQGQPVDIPRYSETSTREGRKWVRLRESPDLPDIVRLVDVIAWRLDMIDIAPVHPRRKAVADDGRN